MTRLVVISSVVMFIILLLLMVDRSEGVPRDQLIQLSCYNQTIAGNLTVFSQNFIQTTEKIRAQVQSSLFGSGSTGIPPDEIFGLVQCFGDLSTPDCIICYDAANFAISRCFPHTGAILYQDGCFMRYQNYSFYDEYSGPSDTTICGNTTTKGSVFESSARQAASNAVRDALVNVDYFSRDEVLSTRVVNESVYVLANCWKTLNVSSCRSCLEDASASILQCLPWSEGRVLNTGCFMRYSDTNFLNAVPVRVRSTSSNQGKIIVLVISLVSVAVLIVAWMIVLYIRKHGCVKTNRKSTYEARKLAKMLHNTSSLNFFKYSTLEKATYKWDESNKLGQGGFGTVYKVWKHFKQGTLEKIFNPNLMMHIYPNINYHKEALRVVQVGLLCIQEAPSLRPIMSTVLKMLAENDEPLPAPTTPPFIDENMELNHITPRLPHLPKCDGDDSSSIATASHSDFYPDING